MLLFLFTALFSTTYAFQPAEDMPCDSPSVVFTSPSVGQTNVPLNVQPIVGMPTMGCTLSGTLVCPTDGLVNTTLGESQGISSAG